MEEENSVVSKMPKEKQKNLVSDDEISFGGGSTKKECTYKTIEN